MSRVAPEERTTPPLEQAPLATEAEEELRHTLLAAGPRLLRITLMLFKPGHNSALPKAHMARG
jgi:hypothetical protein